jgi:predicted metalloprotease with PDZ domain
MKKILSVLSVLLTLTSFSIAQTPRLKYTINLNDISDDLFKVTLDVSGLTAANDVYQFASTAPGTYQVMDIGRFVKDFKAFDKQGNEIAVSKTSDNQYLLSTPTKVTKIVYQIAETWDTKVTKDPVYLMCGSSLEKDNVLINGQCVIGYPKGFQSLPIEIKLEYPEAWLAGTALKKNKDGNYYAETFDKLVDSPILLGNLTKASTTLGKVPVDIYTYSKTNLVKSEQLLNSMKTMLSAADAFIGGLPVDRYTFLFHFEDRSAGAWEHSYSSEYVFKEEPYTEESGNAITSIAAHEFFHVVTPLNIHSEIIEKFNFVTPTPSQHLWLYEGTTEWASDMMQLRYGTMDQARYYGELKDKLTVNANNFDTTYSLLKLSLTSYTPEGQRQYGNIYYRGALVAGLLDIRLLELSGGKTGYREVLQRLLKKYGAHRAFVDKDFFDEFTRMTYPEIGNFFESYIKNANPLPVKEYYGKLGIKYTKELKTGKTIPNIGAGFYYDNEMFVVRTLLPEFQNFGFKENDQVIAINGTPITLDIFRDLAKKLRAQPIGDSYTITIKRPEGETIIKGTVLSKEETKTHVFELDPTATPQQIALREVWLKNK